jgi:hypothetical protein
VEIDGLVPRVATEHFDQTVVAAQQAEQDPHRHCLSGAVRTKEPVDLTGTDFEVQTVERNGGAEGLGQSDAGDRGAHVVERSDVDLVLKADLACPTPPGETDTSSEVWAEAGFSL